MWIQISAGVGPAECARAVFLFAQVLQTELQTAGCKTTCIDAENGTESDTYKSVLISVQPPAKGQVPLITEGSVLWICKSPYRPNHKRKNWFIDMEVYQEEAENSLSITENELKIETMRSSGAGGQHVNKTESAVRITYLPTGVTAVASEERSQPMNKKLALLRLKHQIEKQFQKMEEDNKKTRWMQHKTLERGNPVRTYTGLEFEQLKQ